MKSWYDKFEQYLVTEKMVSPNTVEAYQRDILQCIEFLEKRGSKDFQDVTPDDIKDFLYHLRMVLKVSARSSSRKLSSLKSFSKYLQMYHQIDDFTYGVTFPKLEKNLPKFLTEADVVHLFSVAQSDKSLSGHRNSVMLCLLYVCGVRVSEMISIKASHLDFTEGIARIEGKGGKERIVPLPDSMVSMLKTYLSNVQPHLFGDIKATSDYLFPTMYGGKIKHMSRQAFWGILKKIVKKAGLADTISPHVLRHSIATHLLKKGANLRLLQMVLGHEQLETVQVYTHMDVTHLRKLYDEKHPRA